MNFEPFSGCPTGSPNPNRQCSGGKVRLSVLAEVEEPTRWASFGLLF